MEDLFQVPHGWFFDRYFGIVNRIRSNLLAVERKFWCDASFSSTSICVSDKKNWSILNKKAGAKPIFFQFKVCLGINQLWSDIFGRLFTAFLSPNATSCIMALFFYHLFHCVCIIRHFIKCSVIYFVNWIIPMKIETKKNFFVISLIFIIRSKG